MENTKHHSKTLEPCGPSNDGTLETPRGNGVEATELHRAIQELDERVLWQVFEQHLKDKSTFGTSSSYTLQTYRIGLKRMLEFLRVSERSLFDWRDEAPYAEWLKNSGGGTATIRSRLSVARKVLEALSKAGVDVQPFRRTKVTHDKAVQSTRQPYLPSEIARLLKHADAEEKLIVLLGFEAGLRPGEMADLTREQVHVDAPSAYLSLAGTAGRAERFPLSDTLARALRIWLETTPILSGKLFGGKLIKYLEHRMRDLCQRSKVPYEGRGIQGLRLTAGATIFRETQSVRSLRAFLRVGGRTNNDVYIRAAQLLEEGWEAERLP